VAGEEKNVGGVAAPAGEFAVGNEVNGVSGAGVFGKPVVVIVGPARNRVDDDVLQHAAKADGAEDLRLAFLRETDGFGVAAAFEVEDAVVGPGVLVVADQPAFGIGGQRGLARAGEAEEERGLAGGAQVGRAVHREDALLRQEEIEDRKDRFLDLTGVASAADQNDA